MIQRPSVLIIEDDDTLRRGLSDNFHKHGYHVRRARDGTEGLAEALRQPVDVIILDIMLPKMNGFEVCSEIRACGIDSAIIMLTAKGQEDDVVRGLELGADDYVTKPFSIRELLARAQTFLRRMEQGPCDEFCFGDCRLDLVRHQLYRGGEEVELTSKEFSLLGYLVKTCGAGAYEARYS